MRILFVQDEGIGNMVMATPALQAIKQAQPDCHLTVFGKYPAMEVLYHACDVVGVDEFLTEVKDETYDVVLLSIWSNNFLARYGHDWLRTHSQHAIQAQYNPASKDHESDYHLALARDCGWSGEKPAPYCGIAKVDLAGVGLTSGEYAVLSDTCVSLDWERKRWPHYPDLAGRLLDAGLKVVVVGGQKELDDFETKDYPAEVICLANKLTIGQTAYVIQQSRFFVGNDSGPAHIAGAVGAKTFVLFGATRVDKNKPLGTDVHVIRQALPCAPCQYEAWGGTCRTYECMRDLSVSFVVECLVLERLGITLWGG